ncbi:MAG: MBL fold metallo-hydrolase [Oscillospiraceae bacterium]
MSTYTALFSGSSGNCSLVRCGDESLLIDLGKNCKQVLLALENIGVNPRDIGGILITHEHSDHIGALRVFLKKYKIPVYGTAATLDYLDENGYFPQDIEKVTICGREENIGTLTVNAFRTSHDSVDCCGYKITDKNGESVCIATDLGCVDENVYSFLKGSNLVVLEANYDNTMLTFGSYPYHLKVRIKSQRGHLCNDDTASTVVKLAKDGCKKFALCHLSNENNTPLTALDTVTAQLIEQGICTAQSLADKEILLQANKRNEVSLPIEF